MGGWQRHPSGDKGLSKWFFYEFTEADEPWLFQKGADHRKLAALEIIATLVGIEVFTRNVEPSM
eukprot:10549925-Karenia_brevis.AAC.1